MAKGHKPYEVGYGKPPAKHRFKPGKSGNPKGRPKGARGLKTDLMAELDAKQTIYMNKQPVSGRRQQLMIKGLAARAAAGDLKAARVLLPLMLQIFGPEDRGVDRSRLSPNDQAILDAWLADTSTPDRSEPGSEDQDPGDG